MKIKKYSAGVAKSRLTLKGLAKQLFSWCYILCPINYLIILIHKLCIRKKKTYKYEVSLCLIFKNEAKVLKEWIEYHQLIGIDHFYLYNNFSDDNYIAILNPYIKKGIVTLTDWPIEFGQIPAYHDCYQKRRNETHWLGYIDADEFINLQKHNNIKEFIKGYQAFPALCLYWRMFGTSGVVNESEDYLMTEKFTSSWPWLCHIGKTFINNDYKNIDIGLHQSIAYIGRYPLFPIDDRKLFNPFFINIFSNFGCYNPKAYLNHYWSRSFEFYRYKDYIKGDADSASNITIRTSAGRFEHHELNNYTKDYSIQRWLVLLKKQLI